MRSVRFLRRLFSTFFTLLVLYAIYTRFRRQNGVDKRDDLGFLELAAGVDPIVDIVFIHGLDGHREKSWTANNGTLWGRDLLPIDIPNARYLTYGYDADTRSAEATSTQTIFRHADKFMKALVRERGNARERPIIFVAHSLGGIILKQALVICHNQRMKSNNQLRDISTSTHAVFFFGTPHSGVKGVALLQTLHRILSMFMKTTDIVLQDLKEHSSALENIQAMFLSVEVKNVYFYETYSASLPGGRQEVIVPYYSATIAGDREGTIEALSADHVQIVKYRGKHDTNYKTVLYHLEKSLENAKTEVEVMWKKEKSHRSIAEGEQPSSQNIILPKPLQTVSRNYIQRPDIQSLITEMLLPKTPPSHQPRCILHGLGGGGKTQQGLSWIGANAKNFTRIIVVDGSSQQQIEADLERFIRTLGPEYSELTWKDAIARLEDKERGWLLFLDSADSPDLPLERYLPNSIHGAILITTRNRGYVAYAPNDHIPVGGLTQDQALDLLHSVADVSPLSNNASLAIVEELGNWALAITQAGAYIFESRRLDSYLDIFRKHRSKLMREDSLMGRGYPDPTYVAFDLSFRQLPKKSQEFMKLCAHLHHASIPFELFQRSTIAGFRAHTVLASQPPPESDEHAISYLNETLGAEWDEDTFQHLINSVSRASLLDPSTDAAGETFYNLHSLLQTYIRDLVIDNDDHNQYELAAGQLLHGTIRPLQNQSNNWYWAIVPHIGSLPTKVRHASVAHALALNMVYKSVGGRNASQELLEYSYSQLLETFGAQHTVTIWVMNHLGIALQECGRLGEAEKLQREMLELQRKVLGPRHADAITALLDLARTIYRLGRVEEAEKMEREVLNLRQAVLGERHLDTLEAMHRLAGTLTIQAGDKLEEAERMQREVLRLRQELLGPQNPDTIWTMSHLALTLYYLDRLEEAESLQREVLEFRLNIFGLKHPRTLLSMNNLAQTLTNRGPLEEAERMRREALELRREVLGYRHPDTLFSMHGLGITLRHRGLLKEAEELLHEVVDVRMQTLGHHNRLTTSAMHDLGYIKQLCRKMDEAETIQREVLKLQRTIHGQRHAETIAAMRALATTLELRGQLEEANTLRQEAFESSDGGAVSTRFMFAFCLYC